MNAVLSHKKTALISQNGFINPDAIRHFIVGQSKKYNQCRKLLAGYVNDANKFFYKVKRFFSKIFTARRNDTGEIYSWRELEEWQFNKKQKALNNYNATGKIQ